MEGGAFEGCSRLQEFRISSTHPVFSFQNGMLIDKQQHKVIKGASTGTVYIPDGIETIGEDAFAYMDISVKSLASSRYLFITNSGSSFTSSFNLSPHFIARI